MTLARSRPADDDVLILRRNHIGRHRSLQSAENGDGQNDADDRAAAAEDRDAAEQDDRHDEQLEPDAGVVASRREAERPEHARETTRHPGEDEQPELDPLDADAGVEGCFLVRADREDRAPQRRGMKDDAEDDRERQEDHDRVRDVRVRDRDDADVREALREPTDRVRREDPLRDAAVERQCSDRDGERRQADARDQEAVERPEHATQDDGGDHGRPDRPAVLEQLGHEEPREAEHRGHGEVDLSGDDDQRQRERDDRDLAHVQADEEESGRVQEVR